MRIERIRELYFGEEEEEVLWTRRHVALLLGHFLVTLAAIVIALNLREASNPREASSAFNGLLPWIMLAFVLRFMIKLVDWWCDVIFVTKRRIFEVKGIVPHHVYSMPLWKVTDMTYRRTFWGFAFGYGALILETAGQDQALDHMNYLPDPDGFYKAVLSQGPTFDRPTGGGERDYTPPSGSG